MEWYQALLIFISFALTFFIVLAKYEKQAIRVMHFFARPIMIPVYILCFIGGIVLLSHLQKDDNQSVNIFNMRMNPVVQQAERIKESCEELPFAYRHLKRKVLIHIPAYPGHRETNDLLFGVKKIKELRNIKPGEIKTVVLIEKINDDWGEASGTVILLKQKKSFGFSVSSGVKKKKLGSNVAAYPYIVEYLKKLSITS